MNDEGYPPLVVADLGIGHISLVKTDFEAIQLIMLYGLRYIAFPLVHSGRQPGRPSVAFEIIRHVDHRAKSYNYDHGRQTVFYMIAASGGIARLVHELIAKKSRY